jgi:hypothetical protein
MRKTGHRAVEILLSITRSFMPNYLRRKGAVIIVFFLDASKQKSQNLGGIN